MGKRGDALEAQELLVRAQKMVTSATPDSLKGELLLQRGRQSDLDGQIRPALEHYREAHRLLRDAGVDLTEAELTLASAERRRGEFNLALARLEAIAADKLLPRLRAEYYDELGAVLIARGEARKAISVLEEGLSLDETTASEYAGGRSRLLLAEARMRTGDRRHARELIDETIATYSRTHADAGLSEAYALLGAWFEDGEDFVSAGHYYQESFDLDRSSDDLVGQVRAKRRLARTYRMRGNSSRAEELIRDAKALLPADDDVEKAALCQEEAHLALTRSSPDYEEAIRLFREALEIAREDGDEWATAIAKRNLARAHRENDELEVARDLLLEAKIALEERGDLRELDDLLDDLGEVLLELDEYDGAEAYLEQSLELDDRLGAAGSKAKTLLLMGKVASRKGERDDARRCYEEARDLYRKSRHEVGQSEAYFALGTWHLEQGQLDLAVDNLIDGLQIDNRLNRSLAKVRTKRQLSDIYLQRGNLDRAEEYLREAQRDLGAIDDPIEQALLGLQAGRIQLSNGRYQSAYELLGEARRIFLENRYTVDAGTCQRLMGLAKAYEAQYAHALELLVEAKRVFTQRGDVPELDEVLDDLGTVYLMCGRSADAADAVNQSLELGASAGWRRGKGRSLLLLATIAQSEGDLEKALIHLKDAEAEYADSMDEVGSATAAVALGDWYMDERNNSEFGHAVVAYKNARRILQQHRDRRGAARCNRKLAHVYLERGEYQRADEALQDAEAELKGIDDLREVAPLEFELGRLAAERPDARDRGRALTHLYKARDGFERLGLEEDRRAVLQLLVTVHQARNEIPEALDCLREMGAERASMYNALVRDLHPMVSDASHAPFVAGQYSGAIREAFTALEHDFRRSAGEIPGGSNRPEMIWEVITRWGETGGPDRPKFKKKKGLAHFASFCATSFDLLRNPAVHEEPEYTPADAFAALSVAHWIAKTLHPHAEAAASRDELSL